MRSWLILALLALPSCATYQSAARLYAERGQHELAVFYLAGDFHLRPEKAKASLVLGIQHALRSVDYEYESQAKQGNRQAALGAATRREALLDLARSLGLFDFAAIDAGTLSQKAHGRATKQALSQLDKAEATEKNTSELTQLSRIALAFDPHNPELAVRYERLRSGQVLNLAARTQCDRKHRGACQHFMGLLMTHLTKERSEFARWVPLRSPNQNADLLVRLTVHRKQGTWRRIKIGKAERKLEQKNRFRETRRDAKGDILYQTVRAHYEVFENKTRANVSIHVQIRDLESNGVLLLDTQTNRTESDKRQYLRWQGDERALGAFRRLGTDQSLPKSTDQLTRIAMRKLADRISKQILSKLERSKS